MPVSRNKRTKKKHSVSAASRERQRARKFRRRNEQAASADRKAMVHAARQMGFSESDVQGLL